jgi:hypothetical protein
VARGRTQRWAQGWGYARDCASGSGLIFEED